MDWNVVILPKAQKQLDRLDKVVRNRILSFLLVRLREQHSPWTLAEPLRGKFAGQVRYRVGDYRYSARLLRQKF